MWPLFRKKSRSRASVRTDAETRTVPGHLGVIMDGNGRWAARRALPRSAGHRAGAENLRNLCAWCGNAGVKYLTVYAFSTENWSRPDDEVHALMELFVEFFERFDPELEKEGIRIRFSGDIPALPQRIQEVVQRAETQSVHRDRMQLIVAFNYGGRREIVHAVRSIAESVRSGNLRPDEITEDTLSARMYLPDVPDPDLIIRPSGELRLSNFLLWESAYSELCFDDVLWPDYTEEDLEHAFELYAQRERRYGKVGKG